MPAESKAQRTRSALLDAAERVFARHGYANATVDEMAAEAGFSIGALYSRIGAKEQVFLAVFERYLHQRLAEIRLAARASPGPDETARAWLALVRVRREQLLLFIEFWLYAVRESAPASARMVHALREFDREAESAIAEGLTGDSASSPTPPDAAHAFLALYRGAAMSHALGHDGDHEAFLAEATRRLIKAYHT